MNPLNPIMVVLVIASVGALPLRALAVDVTQPAGVVVPAGDDNSINALGKILEKNPGARKDAGKRIEEFLLQPENGKSFVTADVDAEARTALGAVAREWGESAGKRSDVVILYFVIGPGSATPGWALQDPILKENFVPGAKWEKRLRLALSDWTDSIDKATAKSQGTAFLNEAVMKAKKVFDDDRPMPVVTASVNENNNTGKVVPGMSRTGSSSYGLVPKYELTHLYNEGAKWGNVAGPKDKNSRTISMKVVSKLMPDNSIVDELAICDITNTGDIVCQRFPIAGGDQSFVLNDLEPGKKKYELKFGVADKNGDRSITFARPDGGEILETSVSKLYLARANQAYEMGNIIKKDGAEYYVLPQGGSARSSLLLFSKEVIDGRGAGDSRDLAPSLACVVGTRGYDGRNQNVKAGDKGGPHCGKLGGKDGKEYHVELNETGKPFFWELKDGPGDPPPASTPAPPTTPTPGDPAKPPTGPAADNPTLSDSRPAKEIEDTLLQAEGCRSEDKEGLALTLRGQYGLVACVQSDGVHVILIAPKTDKTPSQQLEYKSPSGFKLLRGRLTDHYLVLEFDKQVQYLDLLKFDNSGNLAVSGLVMVSEKTASQFSDSYAFVDALKNHLGVTDAKALKAVPARVAAALENKSYVLTGSFAKEKLIVSAVSGEATYPIWPTVLPPSTPGGATPAYTSISGPTNAMDGAVSSVDEAFPDKLDLPESRQAIIMSGRKQAGIALYENVDLGGKPEPKKYFLMFKYNGPKNPAKSDSKIVIFRQKWFEVFNSTNPLPANFTMQGLVGGTVVKDRLVSGYRFVAGSTVQKGVLAVFQNRQVSGEGQKDSAENCVGPIVWWGIDRAAALEACQEDGF